MARGPYGAQGPLAAEVEPAFRHLDAARLGFRSPLDGPFQGRLTAGVRPRGPRPYSRRTAAVRGPSLRPEVALFSPGCWGCTSGRCFWGQYDGPSHAKIPANPGKNGLTTAEPVGSIPVKWRTMRDYS